MSEKPTLSPIPARKDMTDREVAKILAGLMGGLLNMTTLDAIKNAVRWWANTPEAWAIFEAVERSVDTAVAEATAEPKEKMS